MGGNQKLTNTESSSKVSEKLLNRSRSLILLPVTSRLFQQRPPQTNHKNSHLPNPLQSPFNPSNVNFKSIINLCNSSQLPLDPPKVPIFLIQTPRISKYIMMTKQNNTATTRRTFTSLLSLSFSCLFLSPFLSVLFFFFFFRLLRRYLLTNNQHNSPHFHTITIPIQYFNFQSST